MHSHARAKGAAGDIHTRTHTHTRNSAHRGLHTNAQVNIHTGRACSQIQLAITQYAENSHSNKHAPLVGEAGEEMEEEAAPLARCQYPRPAEPYVAGAW